MFRIKNLLMQTIVNSASVKSKCFVFGSFEKLKSLCILMFIERNFRLLAKSHLMESLICFILCLR